MDNKILRGYLLVKKMNELVPDLNYDYEKGLLDVEYSNRKHLAFHEAMKFHRRSRECVYALTTTTGKEKDPKVLIRELQKCVDEIPVIQGIRGNIELTKAGLPHTHSVIVCTNYLNKILLKSRIKGHFVLKKVKGLKGWENYIKKDSSNPELKEYLKKYNVESSFELKEIII